MTLLRLGRLHVSAQTARYTSTAINLRGGAVYRRAGAWWTLEWSLVIGRRWFEVAFVHFA